ncbi:MAG: hypothetical protein F6K39_06250 [Okeania sp. SIO3B3]|nr:hypothetical protein [Okeania sp. SIO3B3]
MHPTSVGRREQEEICLLPMTNGKNILSQDKNIFTLGKFMRLDINSNYHH